MLRQLKIMRMLLNSQVDYIIVFSVATLSLVLIHQFVPSQGIAQTFLILSFVYLINVYYGFLLTLDQKKIGEIYYALPVTLKQLIHSDICVILLTNLCGYILWSIFLIGTDRNFMMLPLIYMTSISLFTSVLTMIQKYMNTRFNKKLSLIVIMGTFIYFLFGYMPIQNLYDRGMLNTHAFYFTWLPFVVLFIVLSFIYWTKNFLEKNTKSKHVLWSD
ncbi:hypothetical protein [Macrococcus equi]|uniref:hypothetical protein n=1 Tax=Macrococcus equi TaxID=3395462 RepID=UPI0039BE1FCA